jgi:hypothetical protein
MREDVEKGAICEACGDPITKEAYMIGGDLYHHKCVNKNILAAYTAKEKTIGMTIYLGKNG